MGITKSQYPEISDEDLVVATLLGHMEAFDELVRRFRGAVTAVAEQVLQSREAAEDVAQEAFLLAFKALDQLQEPSRFAAWLCAIARHRARRVAARESRTTATEESELDRLILQESRELVPDPADRLIGEMERAAIHAALSRIPEEYRLVLELYHYDEWPVVRICQFLTLPSTTVRWRLRQGRELVRRQLDPSMTPPPPASGGTLTAATEATNHEREQKRRTANGRHPTVTPAAQGDRGYSTERQHDRSAVRRPAEQCNAV